MGPFFSGFGVRGSNRGSPEGDGACVGRLQRRGGGVRGHGDLRCDDMQRRELRRRHLEAQEPLGVRPFEFRLRCAPPRIAIVAPTADLGTFGRAAPPASHLSGVGSSHAGSSHGACLSGPPKQARAPAHARGNPRACRHSLLPGLQPTTTRHSLRKRLREHA